MIWDDKLKTEYSKFHENFNKVLSEKQEQQQKKTQPQSQKQKQQQPQSQPQIEESQKDRLEREQRDYMMKQKEMKKKKQYENFLAPFKNYKYFTTEEIQLMLELFNLFMDKYTLQVNFYDIFNLYKLFGIHKNNQWVYNVLVEIHDSISKGEMSQMMTFEFFVKQLEEQIGQSRDFGKVYDLIVRKGNKLDIEEIKDILHYIGIEVNRQQAYEFLEQTTKTGEVMEKNEFEAFCKNYYHLQV